MADLDTYLADNVQAWELSGGRPVRAIALAADRRQSRRRRSSTAAARARRSVLAARLADPQLERRGL